jgi:hypothetical protein
MISFLQVSAKTLVPPLLGVYFVDSSPREQKNIMTFIYAFDW